VDMIDNPLQVAEMRCLQPFLPMIYTAWAGGELSAGELRGLRQKLESLGNLDANSQLLLDLWLDPEAPPSAAQLQILRSTIRAKVSDLPAEDRGTLADLGEALARKSGPVPQGMKDLLDEIQTALGAYDPEASQEILQHGLARTEAPPPATPDWGFKVPDLVAYLEQPYGERYDWARRVLAHPRFFHSYGESKEVQRERVFNWCKEIAREGLTALPWPKEYGGGNDPGGFLAAAEMMGAFDGSLLIKFGVHIGLFAGSVYNLGSERHHKEYLAKAISLELPGCFAMTETGHGSNVRDIETTAVFDQERQEFIIHTPHLGARKDYIGNAAMHAQMATVFAQLELGGEDYGVHAFLVPIRDKNGGILPGISIEDNGSKIGLNGVDNGRIVFNQIRVPRANLLDRFAQVSETGEYTSITNNPGKRFFMMLSTLVMGRVSISAAVNAMSKVGLAIAVRYAEGRRQFGPPGGPEVAIMDYQTYQRRLYPHLATAYALTFACRDMIAMFNEEGEEKRRELESLAAGLKVYTSWHAIESLQVCRESCGGQGYLAVNRFGSLKADVDVFATFEGSNPVLLQLVAKGLLTEYKHQFTGNKFFGIVKFLTKQAAVVLSEQNPLTTRNVDVSHLRDPEFHLSALRYREDALLVSAARRLKSRLDKKIDSFQAFNEVQDHLCTMSMAHIERKILESFQKAVEKAPNAEVKTVLRKLCALFALTRIEKDSGWFLESGLLEPVKSKAIRTEVLKLCAEIRPQARALVDAFNFTDKILSAPIALGEVPA
jgi:acyl-CoA oxidase